jgi:hypothetical protein
MFDGTWVASRYTVVCLLLHRHQNLRLLASDPREPLRDVSADWIEPSPKLSDVPMAPISQAMVRRSPAALSLVKPAGRYARVSQTDDELDERSRDLLRKVDDLKKTEQRKRQTARSSSDFHRLADEAEAISRDVFKTARSQRKQGHEDSPIASERSEQHPGDWTDDSG